MDVLCHKNVRGDVKALKELYRVLDEDGVLLLNVPAYNFLISRHDKAASVRQRYTKKELRRKVEKAGFLLRRLLIEILFFSHSQ